MNRPRSIVPPAPPPFWQSEPVLRTPSARSIRRSLPGFMFVAFTIMILTGLFLMRRRRGRTRLRTEEIRLRTSLEPIFGPDAAWLSALALRMRAKASGLSADDATRTAIERLSSIESRRYGPKPAESGVHQRNDQSA